MSNRKLLSIVVPTKDRYKYLQCLIELIAGFESEEVELVIQDNSDDNIEFASYLEGLDYSFIRYDHIKGQIPMAVNSDKAILNSTGEYVCFLGDDDGLTRYTIDCVKWMKKNNVEAVKSTFVYYNWPDVSIGSEGKQSSVLVYDSFTGKVQYLSPYKELLKVLRNGISDRGNMPLVYHSIVERKVLNKVYSLTGTFFPGNSPDISNAVALSLVTKRYALISMPLAFSGCSVFHGGGVHVKGKQGQPSISDIPWFRPDSEANWDKSIPRIASGNMIWADSAIHALKCMGRPDLYNKINFGKLYASFVIENPSLSEYVDEVCVNKISYRYEYLKMIVKKVLRSGCRRIRGFMGLKEKHRCIHNVDSIIEASSRLEEFGLELHSPFTKGEMA